MCIIKVYMLEHKSIEYMYFFKKINSKFCTQNIVFYNLICLGGLDYLSLTCLLSQLNLSHSSCIRLYLRLRLMSLWGLLYRKIRVSKI